MWNLKFNIVDPAKYGNLQIISASQSEVFRMTCAVVKLVIDCEVSLPTS